MALRERLARLEAARAAAGPAPAPPCRLFERIDELTRYFERGQYPPGWTAADIARHEDTFGPLQPHTGVDGSAAEECDHGSA
jgi:hypothetical protein